MDIMNKNSSFEALEYELCIQWEVTIVPGMWVVYSMELSSVTSYG